MESINIFNTYEKARWAMKDLPWDSFQKDKVRQDYLSIARSAMMGECNSIAAVHGFLNEFTDDYDFAAFTNIWGYEELQHHMVFRAYLEKCGEEIDDRPVKATRSPYPPGITPASTLATNVISELTVNKVYGFFSKKIEEPLFRDILDRVSRDEARHAGEFGFYLARRLKEHPEEIQSVLETLFVYTSDPDNATKHPVSVFKGELPELQNTDTIDTGLGLFQDMDPRAIEDLHRRIYSMFSHVLQIELKDSKDVRRALRKMISQQPVTA